MKPLKVLHVDHLKIDRLVSLESMKTTMSTTVTGADPETFSQGGGPGGVGVSDPNDKKKFEIFFRCLILQRGPIVYSEETKIFHGGGLMETCMTCDFPGRFRPPVA